MAFLSHIILYSAIVTCHLGLTEIVMSEGGGYNNIVVEISKYLNEDECPAILKGLKDLLDVSSLSLHKSSSGLFYFQSITVLVPADWKDSSCGVSIRGPGADTPYAPADIYIEKPGAVGGYLPLTQQSSGCGVGGDFISLPHTFISNQNITDRQARQFVHEWSKFRYGIFDESGFPGDSVYPGYYRRDGKPLPVVSHNGILAGMWLKNGEACNPTESAECIFTPEPTDEITCSLGNGLNLANSYRYCNSSEFKTTPTKQAVLCQGLSTQDVISRHADFIKVQSGTGSGIDLTPEIRIVRGPPTKFVLAIDTSATMNDHWRWIVKAAHKFIRYDMPVNSNLAVLTFNDKAKIEHPLIEVTSDDIRGRLADLIPVKYHLSTGERSCVACLVQTVFKDVLKNNMAGAHIILVTHGNREINTVEMTEMKNLVINNNAKLSSIIIPSDRNEFFGNIADLSQGLNYQLSDTGHSMDFLFQMNSAFSSILRQESIYPTEIPELVHQAEYYSGDEGLSEGRFIIDATLGRDTMFGIYVKDEEDHLIRSVQFTDSRGNVYGPFSKMSSSFDRVNLKTINYIGQVPPFGDSALLGTEWKYRIEWDTEEGRTRKSLVVLTSKPRSKDESQLISVTSWTSGRDGEDQLIRVLAKVRKGLRPILNASVYLDVEIDTENGTGLAILPLQMLDNGHGDVDLMSGDGIYSAVLTSYPSTGRYKFTLRVSGTNTTLVPVQGAIAETAGGSAVKFAAEKLVPTGEFFRTVSGPVEYIAKVPDTRTIPPGKVTNLEIQVGEEGRLFSSWTSSGGDLNSGSVSGYRFVYSEDISELLDINAEPRSLINLDLNQPAGVLTTQDIQFPYYEQDYYIGLIPVDSDGNLGMISNLVHVFLPAPPSLLQDAGLTSPAPSLSILNSEKDWIMVGVICGILLVLIVISVVSISYFCCMSRKPRQERKSATGSVSDVHVVSSGSSDHTDGTDAGSFDSDMKNLSGNNIVTGYDPRDIEFGLQYTGSRHLEVETPTKDSGASTRATPVYWSASQLLSKLEEGGSYAPEYSYHYSTASGVKLSDQSRSINLEVAPLPTEYLENRSGIPEEFCVTVSNLPNRYTDTDRYADSQATSVIMTDSFRNSHRSRDRALPPPLYPKPKNITQV